MVFRKRQVCGDRKTLGTTRGWDAEAQGGDLNGSLCHSALARSREHAPKAGLAVGNWCQWQVYGFLFNKDFPLMRILIEGAYAGRVGVSRASGKSLCLMLSFSVKVKALFL